MVLVLDASALISGFDPSHLKIDAYTVPGVIDELTRGGLPAERVEISQKIGRLKIIPPTQNSIRKAYQACQDLGEYSLSKADIEVIALALDLHDRSHNPSIVSDDYGIQNVAEYLNIRYIPLADKGIQRFFKWMLYCPACFKMFHEGEAKNCPVCGTSLKRKPKAGSLVKFKM